MRWNAHGKGVRPIRPPTPPPEPPPTVAAPVEIPLAPPDEPADATPAAAVSPVEDRSNEAEALFVARRADTRAKRGGGSTRTAPPTRIPSILLAGWGVALLVAAIMVVAIVRREELASAYPALAGVYAAIGLPVAESPPAAVPKGTVR